jgi:hypothetical protein
VRAVAVVALLASLIALVADRLPGPVGDFSLERARAFDEYPLYYAGEEVDGLPLTDVLRRDAGAGYVSFVYGECTPSSDGGCAPPAEVQVWPGGARKADSYGAVPGTPALERTTIRGLPAALVGDGTQVELYAGRSTIVVFAHTRERALAVATALRCVRAGGGVEGPTGSWPTC